MQAVLWWLIPLGATALAIAWVAWVGRSRPPADPHDTVAEHLRFRAAMDRGVAPEAESADGNPAASDHRDTGSGSTGSGSTDPGSNQSGELR